MDTRQARRLMVEGQVRTADVNDLTLLDAMRAIPREAFVPKSQRALAYSDMDVPLTAGRALMRPRDFGKLAQAAEIGPSDVVLELACGRGYGAAVFSRLAETVVAVESDPALVSRAAQAVSDVGADNASVIEGDIRIGAPDQGPFDVIFVHGAAEHAPHAWFEQLADGGRLAVVLHDSGVGVATVFLKAGGATGGRDLFNSSTPVLPELRREPAFVF